ncbi:MAG: ferritin-like domain-containing protein [Planctomycetota bacterium]
MKLMTMADLYLDQLQDMHSCERQLIRAIPRMARAASHPQLQAAFNDHLVETKGQLERLNTILENLDKGPGRKVCEATVGLIKEGTEIVDANANANVRDAGLICAAQKIEHYEIASYGCLRTFASLLGRGTDVRLLDRSLGEEHGADKALTSLAMSVVNADARA